MKTNCSVACMVAIGLLIISPFTPCFAKDTQTTQPNENKTNENVQPVEQLADLTRMANESVKKVNDSIMLFMAQSDKSLKTVPEVKQRFSQYVASVTDLLKSFEESSPIMKRISNLTTDYSERKRRLIRKAKDIPEKKEQYLNLATTYERLVGNINSLRKQLRETRGKGQDAILKLVDQEDMYVEIVMAGDAVKTVEALEAVTVAFQQSITDTNKVVNKIIDNTNELKDNALPR